MEFEPGARVEHLEIERELGRGAFGVVYLAQDNLLGRRVALKVLPGAEHEVGEDVRAQVLDEARIIAGLRSPHIVTLYRLHEAPDGGFWQEMEFVSGGSLEDRLEEGEPLPLAEAVRIFRGVCLALRTSHAARIVHGDIKPANVLFGGDDEVKLADFGVARLLAGDASEMALHGKVFGSPLYMAPEVISGRSTGFGSDLWSAAVLLHMLLAGRLPFPAATISELIPKILRSDPEPLPPEVPGPLAELLASLLEKELPDRPESAANVIEALDCAVPATAEGESPTNILPEAESLVGRERELEEIGDLLGGGRARLVTLAGPPGVGKTRLARELGARLTARFEGGVWYVDVETARDEGDVHRLVAAALGGGDLRYRKALLLVLDGFEHLRPHAPSTVGEWLRELGHVSCLVASRAVLGLAGERVHELGPLPEADAALLYRERVGGEPGEEESIEVARAVECMPLGIVRAATLGPEGGREVLVRAVERSFSLLDSAERATLLEACGFPDGLTLFEAEDAIDLSGLEDAPLVMDVLQSLREKSLVVLRGDRFVLQGFVREFGLRRRG